MKSRILTMEVMVPAPAPLAPRVLSPSLVSWVQLQPSTPTRPTVRLRSRKLRCDPVSIIKKSYYIITNSPSIHPSVHPLVQPPVHPSDHPSIRQQVFAISLHQFILQWFCLDFKPYPHIFYQCPSWQDSVVQHKWQQCVGWLRQRCRSLEMENETSLAAWRVDICERGGHGHPYP